MAAYQVKLLNPSICFQEFALPWVSRRWEEQAVIELSVSKAECQILEQLLQYLQSAEAARQALAKLVYGFYQARLRQLDSTLESTNEFTLGSVCIVDLETKRLIRVNSAFQQWLGYSQTEGLALSFYDLVGGDRHLIDRQIHHLLLEQHCLLTKQLYRHKNGTWLEAEAQLKLIPFAGALAICVTAWDAAERKRAEALVDESEAKFRAVAGTAESAVFVYQDEQLCYVNPATEQMTGYTQAELYTMDLWDLVDPDLLSHANNLETQWRKPVFLSHQLDIVTKSGKTLCLEIIAAWAKLNGRPALIGTACDSNQVRQKVLSWNAIARSTLAKMLIS